MKSARNNLDRDEGGKSIYMLSTLSIVDIVSTQSIPSTVGRVGIDLESYLYSLQQCIGYTANQRRTAFYSKVYSLYSVYLGSECTR